MGAKTPRASAPADDAGIYRISGAIDGRRKAAARFGRTLSDRGHSLYSVVLGENERAVFIIEDDRLLNGTYIILGADRDRMIPITTRDFLEGLEGAQRINSVEEVYRRAEDADRLSSKRAALAGDHERARAAVENLLRTRRDKKAAGQ